MNTNGFTGGIGDGSAPYTETEFRNYNRAILAGNYANGGVLSGVDNELLVSGAASPLSVASGQAQVYGFHYFNTAALAPTVTTPTVGDTGGRVVVRANLTAANAPPSEDEGRVRVVLNTDGNPSIPALNQTADTTWDIPLATFVIATSGIIYTDSSKLTTGVSDARHFAISPLAASVRLRQVSASGASTFSIPYIQGDLKHLRLESQTVGVTGSTNLDLWLRMNADTGNTYSWHQTILTNVTATAAKGDPDSKIIIGKVVSDIWYPNQIDGLIIDILDYANTSKHKAVRASSWSMTDGTFRSYETWGWWRSVAAINQLSLVLSGGFSASTNITLYGLR